MTKAERNESQQKEKTANNEISFFQRWLCKKLCLVGGEDNVMVPASVGMVATANGAGSCMIETELAVSLLC